MYDILQLRLLVSDFSNIIPDTKRELFNYIYNIISEVKNEIIKSKPKKINETISYNIYEGYLDNNNILQVSRKHYIISNEDQFLPVIATYLTDRKLYKSLVKQLGLYHFKGSKLDLLNIVNIQSGLPWDVNRAKKVCLLSYEELLGVTNLSYLNSVLGYVTGYIMEDSQYPFMTIDDILLTYLGYYLIPFLRNNKHRPTNNIAYHINSPGKYIHEYSFALHLNKRYRYDYVSDITNKLGMSNDSLDYFINSVSDYTRVNKFTMNNRPRDKKPLIEVLSEYSDKALLEAIEEPIIYRYRNQLVQLALEVFSTFTWSLNRRRLCKDKYEVVLSRGRAMDYECYDPYALWSYLEEDDISYRNGLVIDGKNLRDPSAYLDPNEVEILTASLLNLDSIPPSFYTIDNKSEYLANVEDGKRKILVVCYDNINKPLIEKEIYKEFSIKEDAKTSSHLKMTDPDDIVYNVAIDYVGIDLAKLKGTYYTIDAYSHPNDTTLTLLDNSGEYKYIIYECQMKDIELDVIQAIIQEGGKLFIRKRFPPSRDINIFFRELGGTDKYRVYVRVKEDIMKYFLDDRWSRVSTRGDGNCMFYSITQSLQQGHTSSQLRKLSIDNMSKETFENYRKDFRKSNGRLPTDDEVISRLMSNSQLGTVIELKILAKQLNFIPIIINAGRAFNRKEAERALCYGANATEVNKMKRLRRVILLYQSGCHFENIRRNDGKVLFDEEDLPEKLVTMFKNSCFLITEGEKDIERGERKT